MNYRHRECAAFARSYCHFPFIVPGLWYSIGQFWRQITNVIVVNSQPPPSKREGDRALVRV